MKQIVKRILYSVAPQWTTAWLSARARAQSQRVVAGWGCGAVNQKLLERFGSDVQEGPFAGMTLTPMTYAEQIGPQLLGVYESELDDAWSVVFHGSYSQIIDVGAKFGYYAIGLARKYSHSKVIAFDTDWWARDAIREMAAANLTGNVAVEGFCSRDWLCRNVEDGAFVLSDCEGYESALFDRESIPRLRSATLVIETHDALVPGINDKLRTAFAATHSVRVFGDGLRRATTRSLDFLSEPERQLAVQEIRSHQTWLLCLPKTGPNLRLANDA